MLLVKRSIRLLALAGALLVQATAQVSRLKNKVLRQQSRGKKECITMKKSVFLAAIAAMAAVIGALVAIAVYLRRREKELDEYERLLFSDDGDDYDDDDDFQDDTVYEKIPAQPAADAPDAADAE